MRSTRGSEDARSVAEASDLLLSVLDPTDRAWLEHSSRDLSGLPWEWIFERAKHHKVMALLLARLSESGHDLRLADSHRKQLAEESAEIRDRSKRAATTLALVGEVARDLDSPFFLIKGALLAQEVYGAHHKRTFNDVDIVVPSDRVDDFDRALRVRGYYFWASPQIHQDLPRWFLRGAPPGEVRGSKDEARRILSRFHRHYLYVLKEGDPRLPVEVHWHIFAPGDSAANETDLWRHITRLEIGGSAVNALDREATLLHCAVHALEGGPQKHRLLHLADVIWILHQWGPSLEPESLEGLARRWKVGGALTAAIEAARNVFPFPVPEAVNRLWPHRSAWARSCLRSAGLGPGIVAPTNSANRWIRALNDVRADALWEVAAGHAPVAAWGRVRRLFSTRLLRRPRVQTATRESDVGG